MSSVIIPSHEERMEPLLPVINTDLFAQNTDSTFWVGKIADLNGELKDSELIESVARLRANVYIDEKKYLGEEARKDDGTESDENDLRSIRFAAIENIGYPAARTIACGRAIVKLSLEDPLPIETYFPEVFGGEKLPLGSVEISRFISRHPNKLTQHTASLAVIRAMAFETVRIQAPSDYCIIERPLLKMLKGIGLPVEQLGQEKNIPEQNGVLYPVEINPAKILEIALSKEEKAANAILQMFFANEEVTSGLGYFPETLMR